MELNTPRIYHFSEDGNIETFHPRSSKAQWGYTPYVWGIGNNQQQHYLLPRDCPRICVSNYAHEEVHLPSDIVPDTKAFIAVPIAWRASIVSCTLYRYEFSPVNFHCIDPIAGYFVSQKTEKPISITKITDCATAIKNSQTQLLFLSDNEFLSLKEKVVQSLDNFSIIRWNNFIDQKK